MSKAARKVVLANHKGSTRKIPIRDWMDDTLRKRAEEAPRHSEEYFRALIETSLDTIMILDSDGNICYVSPSMERVFGYDPKELIGKSSFEFIHPEDLPRVIDDFAQIVQNLECIPYIEIRTLHKDGSWRYVEAIARNLLDNPTIAGIVVNFRDVTERKRIEKELRESEEKLQHYLESSPDAICVADLKGTILYTKGAVEKMMGYSREELVGKNFLKLGLLAPGHSSKPTQWLEAGGAERPVRGDELELTRKDGSRLFVEVSTVSLCPEGEVDRTEVIGIVRDISERKRGEEERERLSAELADKNRELEQIIYVTSHDLRSPLVNIQGFSKELNYSLQELVSILQNEDISSEVRGKLSPIIETDIADALTYIQASMLKMDSLLSGLLRLSRLGRAALNSEQLDMNQLVTEIVKGNEYRIKGAKVTVEVGDLPPCIGDSVQINQVFSNLLDNALKYLDLSRPGIIRITGRVEEDQVVYCVEDNGIGIPEEHRTKVFEIFHQLDPGTSTGEGLGLSVVEKILSRHNGRAWVESEPGVGSKFFISLPAIT